MADGTAGAARTGAAQTGAGTGIGTGVPLAEVWRGGFLECVHRGHAVVCDPAGEVVESWGDPTLTVLPRSACKMIQALPLAESGLPLSPERWPSPAPPTRGAAVHTEAVGAWLADLGLGDGALRCGAHMPSAEAPRDALIRAGSPPRQVHNNCSGKHAGFLMLAQHLKAGPEYVEPDHPVQRAVRDAFEEATGAPSPGHAVDGCSAPNFATSLSGLAAAMARFAAAGESGARGRAMLRLREAMIAHPDLVAGEGRACTELMRAMREGGHPAAIKTGAEGVFVAILPERGLGVALKVDDGATRASECAIAAILARLGALDPAHPAARARLAPAIRNWRGIETGTIRPAEALTARGRPS